MAVTLTAAALRDALGLSDDTDGNATAARLLALATAAVNAEGASAAPEAIANEALTRTAAYLQHRYPSGALTEVDIGGDVRLRFRAPGNAVRLSGARALLAPYRPRDLVVAADD